MIISSVKSFLVVFISFGSPFWFSSSMLRSASVFTIDSAVSLFSWSAWECLLLSVRVFSSACQLTCQMLSNERYRNPTVIPWLTDHSQTQWPQEAASPANKFSIDTFSTVLAVILLENWDLAFLSQDLKHCFLFHLEDDVHHWMLCFSDQSVQWFHEGYFLIFPFLSEIIKIWKCDSIDSFHI